MNNIYLPFFPLVFSWPFEGPKDHLKFSDWLEGLTKLNRRLYLQRKSVTVKIQRKAAGKVLSLDGVPRGPVRPAESFSRGHIGYASSPAVIYRNTCEMSLPRESCWNLRSFFGVLVTWAYLAIQTARPTETQEPNNETRCTLSSLIFVQSNLTSWYSTARCCRHTQQNYPSLTSKGHIPIGWPRVIHGSRFSCNQTWPVNPFFTNDANSYYQLLNM